MVLNTINNNDSSSTKEEKRMFVGILWNCAAELKLLITAIVFLCSLAIVLQFLPPRFSLSPSDVRHCLSTPLSSASSSPDTPLVNLTQHLTNYSAQQQTVNSRDDTNYSAQQQQTVNSRDDTNYSAQQQTVNSRDELLENGALKRGFNPYGAAAYNFILMSAYRGGPDTFAVMGLSSKPLHVYGRPTYRCLWVPNQNPLNTTSAAGWKILPDWGYGRVYTVVVVNCTFPTPVGADGNGGRLIVEAATNDWALNTTDSIVAVEETPLDYANFTEQFTAPRPKYDYLYCGSSLYGNLSPQRVREWLAYHVRLLGPKSHFVIHDAGGVHDGVLQVLKPWMDRGFVTLQDIREQEKFDGYYHNQFLIVNDCLHRYRFAAKWMFFFDVDEFIYVPKKSTVSSVLDSFSDFTQITIEQMTMSNKLCLSQDAPPTAFRKWGFEKLVYKDVKRGIRRDRKYAVQPRNVYATGVHMSQNTKGKTMHKTYGRIKYFHYHGTIAQRQEPCRELVNSTDITLDGVPYVLDTTMREIAPSVKRFELKMIGSVLQRTRQ